MEFIPPSYHGCYLRNKDGTNVLLNKNERCFSPTQSPFWKDAKDITNYVSTRSTKKDVATSRDQKMYFINKQQNI